MPPKKIKKKKGAAPESAVIQVEEAPEAAAPASASPPSSAFPKPQPTEEDPAAEWVTLKLKVLGWKHVDAELTLPTSTPLVDLQHMLEERYGPFTDLLLSLEAAPGHPGHTALLDSRAGSCPSDPSDKGTTLAACGVWGRRHRRRADAEGAASPVVRFLYCTFKPTPDDPLLRYDAGPQAGWEGDKDKGNQST